MNPELAERLARINELTDEELDQLEQDLIDEFDRIDGEAKPSANSESLNEVAGAIDTVRGERGNRETAAAEAEQHVNDLRNRVHAEEPDPDAPPADDPEAPSADADADPDAVAASGAPARTTPRRPSLGQLSAGRRGPNVPRPKNTLKATSTVKALIHGGGKAIGDTFDSMDEVIFAMTDRIGMLGAGNGEPVYVARAELAYPDERRITNNSDAAGNTRMFDSVAGREALVAAGGICTPVDVDYTILVTGDDSEPLAGDLPSYAANRGGLRFLRSPTLQSVGTAGTTLWTEALDAALDPTAPSTTKPVQRFNCPAEDEVLVDAIPTRFQFGNFMGKFSPEVVDANTRIALINAARFREIHRLNQIAAHSTAVTTAQLLGAARDFLATLDQAAAAYRYRHRLNRAGVNLRAVLPAWTIDLLRADLAREMAHGDDSNLTLSDADVTSMIMSRGIAVTWVLDGQPTNAAAGPGGPLAFTAQDWGGDTLQAQGALKPWPNEIVWYLFAEGTFQRLDGGTLDVGVVRDSALNSVNEYETFIEVFEAIAMRGNESLQLISTLCPSGASAGTISTAALCV